MPDSSTSPTYDTDAANLKDVEALAARLHALLQLEVTSVAKREEWLVEEGQLRDEIGEAMAGHRIDFFRDTADASKRAMYLHDQTAVQPLHAFKNAQREESRRAFNMLINPLSGDLFHHWLYTNPNHSPAERDAKFLEISKRFLYHPVDLAGLESEVGAGWTGNVHYFAYPFYKIEYAISELGALQLLQIYRAEPARAIDLFKQGAGTDLNQSIAQTYRDTGVEFDFSDQTVEKTAQFVERLITELQ